MMHEAFQVVDMKTELSFSFNYYGEKYHPTKTLNDSLFYL